MTDSSRCPRLVMPGQKRAEDARRRAYDPGIHRKNVSFSGMDCRVKPGNDGGGASANNREHGESND
jgi:hypothetical protein